MADNMPPIPDANSAESQLATQYGVSAVMPKSNGALIPILALVLSVLALALSTISLLSTSTEPADVVVPTFDIAEILVAERTAISQAIFAELTAEADAEATRIASLPTLTPLPTQTSAPKSVTLTLQEGGESLIYAGSLDAIPVLVGGNFDQATTLVVTTNNGLLHTTNQCSEATDTALTFDDFVNARVVYLCPQNLNQSGNIILGASADIDANPIEGILNLNIRNEAYSARIAPIQTALELDYPCVNQQETRDYIAFRIDFEAEEPLPVPPRYQADLRVSSNGTWELADPTFNCLRQAFSGNIDLTFTHQTSYILYWYYTEEELIESLPTINIQPKGVSVIFSGNLLSNFRVIVTNPRSTGEVFTTYSAVNFADEQPAPNPDGYFVPSAQVIGDGNFAWAVVDTLVGRRYIPVGARPQNYRVIGGINMLPLETELAPGTNDASSQD